MTPALTRALLSTPAPEPSVSPFTSIAPRLIVIDQTPLELTGGALDALQLAEIFVQVYNADQRPAIRNIALLCGDRGWEMACHAIFHALDLWMLAENQHRDVTVFRPLRAERSVQPLDVPCRTCASMPSESCVVLNDGENRVVPHPSRVADADARNAESNR